MNDLRPDLRPDLPVAIVGAGPAGLAAARALKVRDLPYVQIERHSDVGGIWDIDNPGTPMYKTAHFISSRDKSGFFDFPMPKTFADYPSREQILHYTRAFTDAYGLREHIVFDTEVRQATQHDDDTWSIETSNDPIHASALICCNGVTWDAKSPAVPGDFTGEVRHSVTYHDPAELAGRRVLVVGLGNSGADIASDAAIHADTAFISTRRGYHFLPKFVLGKPSDETEGLPIWAERLLYRFLVKPFSIGDVTRWGLPKPDHKLFETHPLINTELLHHLQHGRITAKPNIAAFDQNEVVFTDGTREEVDLVLFATGYDMSIPYVPDDYLSWRGGRPQMYLNAFARRREGLFGVSYIEVNSSAYTLFDRVGHLIGEYLADRRSGSPRTEQFRQLVQLENPDLTGGVKFVNSDRHATYVEVRAYKSELARVIERMGWRPLTHGFFDRIRDTKSPAVR